MMMRMRRGESRPRPLPLKRICVGESAEPNPFNTSILLHPIRPPSQRQDGYAWECQTPEGGWGLDAVVRDNNWKLRGIVNGIDYE